MIGFFPDQQATLSFWGDWFQTVKGSLTGVHEDGQLKDPRHGVHHARVVNPFPWVEVVWE